MIFIVFIDINVYFFTVSLNIQNIIQEIVFLNW
jgi:hypothetical protein